VVEEADGGGGRGSGLQKRAGVGSRIPTRGGGVNRRF
jgi:hypothetical protein